jgi:hypothetical protein
MMNIEQGISNHEVRSRRYSLLHSTLCGSLFNFLAGGIAVAHKGPNASVHRQGRFQGPDPLLNFPALLPIEIFSFQAETKSQELHGQPVVLAVNSGRFHQLSLKKSDNFHF